MPEQNNSAAGVQAECCSTVDSSASGCCVSLCPMCDDFVNVILGSLKKVDTSKVYAATDHLSTIYRGRQAHVLDCARALFLHAFKDNVHMMGRFSFSKGCPKEAAGFMELDDKLSNAGINGNFYAYAKISLYALGVTDYKEHNRFVFDLAEKHRLKPKPAYNGVILEGSADQLFTFLGEAVSYAHNTLPRYALEAVLSVNSPSPVK